MSRFMLLYRGDATPPEAMSQEQREEVMGQWMAWMDKLGPALKDPGSPFGAKSAVGGDGHEQPATNLTGYTVVEAEDLTAAQGFCDGHPFLDGTGADFAIEVIELVEMG